MATHRVVVALLLSSYSVTSTPIVYSTMSDADAALRRSAKDVQMEAEVSTFSFEEQR
jgi:hypothetical protein